MPFATRLATDLPADRYRTVSSAHRNTFRLVRTIRPHPDRQSITARRFFIFPACCETLQTYILCVHHTGSIQSDRTSHRFDDRMQEKSAHSTAGKLNLVLFSCKKSDTHFNRFVILLIFMHFLCAYMLVFNKFPANTPDF